MSSEENESRRNKLDATFDSIMKEISETVGIFENWRGRGKGATCLPMRDKFFKNYLMECLSPISHIGQHPQKV